LLPEQQGLPGFPQVEQTPLEEDELLQTRPLPRQTVDELLLDEVGVV
jgi:hypothetical protein